MILAAIPAFDAVWWAVAWWPALLALVGNVLLVRWLAYPRNEWKKELRGLLFAQAVGFWLVVGFASDRFLGGGDAYHYSLQLSDFFSQLRHGVFPVLVGQSEYGFNGNIHTLRTAPYFVHFCSLLHAVTFGQLTAFGVQNLALITSIWGGATTCYFCIRTLAPDWRAAAPFLAALYLLCPAIMAILAGMDMYPTIMTLPWLPLFWFGVAGSLRNRNDTRALILSTGSLGVIWYAHPAVAVWITPFWLGAQLLRLVFLRPGWRQALHPLLAGLFLGAILLFPFVSVDALQLQYANNKFGTAANSLLQGLQISWEASWLPVTVTTGSLGNVQLGYSLAAVALLSLIAIRRTRLTGIFFAAVLVAYVLLLCPWFHVAHSLWSIVPDRVVDATNVWPMQRFYPILAAALPIGAALALRDWPASPRQRHWAISLLVLGTIWSAWEERFAREHTWVIRHSNQESRELLQPINVALGRVSYLFFDYYPIYYSHGVMEPEFETRLLDNAFQPLLENGSALLALKSQGAPLAKLVPRLVTLDSPDVKRREASFKTDGESQYLLAFSFATSDPGEIELLGNGLRRLYRLPEFGEARAFGAGPQSSRLLPICLPPGPPIEITLRTEMSTVSAQVFAFKPEELPIKTESLIPLTLTVDAPTGGLLETPRVFIPGYRATVNGVETSIVKTAERLVAVAVPQGLSRVVLTYEGPFWVRFSYWFSGLAFVIFVACSTWAWRRFPPEISL